MVPQTDLPVCASLHSAHPPLSRKYDDKSFVFVRPTSLLLWSWPAGQLWILLCEEGNTLGVETCIKMSTIGTELAAARRAGAFRIFIAKPALHDSPFRNRNRECR